MTDLQGKQRVVCLIRPQVPLVSPQAKLQYSDAADHRTVRRSSWLAKQHRHLVKGIQDLPSTRQRKEDEGTTRQVTMKKRV